MKKQCLAVTVETKRFCSYLCGLIVFTDKFLHWLVKLRDPSGHLVHWARPLQKCDFIISRKNGQTHGDVDCWMALPMAGCSAGNFDHYITIASSKFPDAGPFGTEQQKAEGLQPLLGAVHKPSGEGRFYMHNGLTQRKTC